MDNPQRFEDGGTAGPADNIPDCLAKIFNKNPLVGSCAGNGCHNPGGGPIGLGGGLDLTSPMVGSRLINVDATHAGVDMDGGVVMCPTAKLIDTANPTASWLLVKISGTVPGSCGSAMPQVGTLSSTQKACITSYVMGVAADAGASTGGTSGMGTGGSTAIAGTGGAPAGGGSGGAAAAGGGAGGAATAGSGGSGGASGGGSSSAGTGGT